MMIATALLYYTYSLMLVLVRSAHAARFCFVCIKQEYNKVIPTICIYHCLFCLSAIFMIIGFSVFADKTKEEPGMDFGYSFYLAIVSSVLHILVAVVGGVQKRISDG